MHSTFRYSRATCALFFGFAICGVLEQNKIFSQGGTNDQYGLVDAGSDRGLFSESNNTTTPAPENAPSSSSHTTIATAAVPVVSGGQLTSIWKVFEPRRDDFDNCRLIFPVEVLTQGQRTSIERGKASVMLTRGGEELLFTLHTDERTGPENGHGGVLWDLAKWIFGVKYTFEYRAEMPLQCAHIPKDPVLYAEEMREGEHLTGVLVQLSPAVRAILASSSNPIPRHLDNQLFPKGSFGHIGSCIFIMELPEENIPESVIVTATARGVSVVARNPNTLGKAPMGLMNFPCECKPEKLSLVQWWTTVSADSTRLILYVGHTGSSRWDGCYTEPIPFDGPSGEVPKYRLHPFFKSE